MHRGLVAHLVGAPFSALTVIPRLLPPGALDSELCLLQLCGERSPLLREIKEGVLGVLG